MPCYINSENAVLWFVQAIALGAQDHLVVDAFSPADLVRRIFFAIERKKWETRRIDLWAAQPHWLTQHTDLVATESAAIHPAEIDRDHRQPDVAAAGTSGQAKQVLLVEDDHAFLNLVRDELEHDHQGGFDITHVDCLAAAVDWLEQHRCDCILLDISLPDSDWYNTLAKVRPRAGTAPVIALTWHDNILEAIEGIRQGAQDYLVKSQLSNRVLSQAVHMGLARRDRLLDLLKPQPADDDAGGPRIDYTEKRQHARYCLTKPLYTIPILPGGAPDLDHRSEGTSLDLSAGGIGFEIGEKFQLPTKKFVIGVESDDGKIHFTTVEIRRATPTARGMELGARFEEDADSLFCEENLLPQLNTESGGFRTPLSDEIMAQWAQLGVLQPTLVDRIYACPQCQGLPTFRTGCRACGSIHTTCSQLIHHFACAHVGFVVDFEQPGEMVCPKCRLRSLVVGADFEYVNGPHRCLSCDWSDTELEQVGQCLRCSYRFPAHQAAEQELIGYYVNRLDPLALIGAS